MEQITRRLIQALWEGRPEDLRSAPASETTLLEFEAECGPSVAKITPLAVLGC